MSRRSRERDHARLLARARGLIEEGHLDEAHAALDLVLRDAPQHYPALLALARLELARGRYPSVIFQARRLIRLDPDRTEGHRLLVQVLLAEGRTDEAVEVAREAAARTPDAGLLIDLAHAEMYAGEVVAAAQAAEHAIEVAPEDDEPYATLARLAWQADEPVEALRLYDEAIARAPVTGGARRQYRLERDRVVARFERPGGAPLPTEPPEAVTLGGAGAVPQGGDPDRSAGRRREPSPAGAPDEDDVIDLRDVMEQELVIDLRDMLEREPEEPLRLPFRWPGRRR